MHVHEEDSFIINVLCKMAVIALNNVASSSGDYGDPNDC